MIQTEQSLYDCLQYCKVAKLPESWDKKSVWVTSIARVLKNDGNRYYCYCERDKEGKPKIVKDFGACRAIIEIEEHFPLIYLDSSYLRKFKKDEEGTKMLVQYLKSTGVVIDYENADRKALDKENIKIAIQKQLAEEKKKNKVIIKY